MRLQGLINPLTMLGTGLLSAGGQSRNPGDVSLGRGLNAGMQNLMQYQHAQTQRAMALERMRQARAQEEQRRLDAMRKQQEQQELAEAQAKAQAESQQTFAGLLNKLPEDKRETVGLLYSLDPKAGLKAAQGLLSPDAPSNQFELWMRNPERAAALMRQQEQIRAQFGGPRAPTIYVGGASEPVLTTRPITREEAERFNINPENASDWVINKSGDLKRKDEDPAAKAGRVDQVKENVKAESALSAGIDLIEQYKKAAENAGSGILGFTADPLARAKADQVRNTLASWWAKNILGTPGAEPSKEKELEAKNAIPDFSGPLDRYTLIGMLDNLESIARSALGGKSEKKPSKDVPPPPAGFVEDK